MGSYVKRNGLLSRRCVWDFINQNKNAFLNDRSCFLKADLDIDKMNEAAQVMIGKMDFTSLSKLHTDVKTNICDVRFAKWEKVSENELVFEIRADRFLRNMVRATVGTLLDVGMGKISAQEYKDILEAKNRCEASVSVPAQGLFLWEVKY